MSETAIIALINFATKFGIQAAISIGEAINKPAVTIDDALSALKDIEAKGAPAYLAAAGGPAYAQPTAVAPLPNASSDPVKPPSS